MKKTTALLPLYKRFISESLNGKRLKLNGERITKGTIKNYMNTYDKVIIFCEEYNFDFRAINTTKLNQREFKAEKNYWEKFYLNFTKFLYKSGHDNYVGSCIKYLKVFFNYIRLEHNIDLSPFYKKFYVRKESVPIMTLSQEQLKFLIHDKKFETRLTPLEQYAKDSFVFGCTTGLRFSDITKITIKNFEINEGRMYLRVKSKKTKVFTNVLLPKYAEDIVNKYISKKTKVPIFYFKYLNTFNDQLKRIGKKAKWDFECPFVREKLGVPSKNKDNKITKPFYEFMSSHMMRRTAVTTMLVLGMPEHLVRNVSGHSNNSGAFYRYVHHAQSYINQEISKVHDHLSNT